MYRKCFSIITVIFLTIGFIGASYAVDRTEKNNIEIQPNALVSERVRFTDLNDNVITSISKDVKLRIKSELEWFTLYLADGNHVLLVDAGFNRPNIISTNQPMNSFSLEYVSDFGEYCWKYDSGTFWYGFSHKSYVDVETSAHFSGNLKAMAGSTRTVSNNFGTSFITVN